MRQVHRQLDGGAVLPQAFERVELPVLVLQDMDNDVAVVHQDPVGVGETLPGTALGSGMVHGLIDRIDDGVDMAVVRPGSQEEDIGESQSLGDVNGGEVLSLLIGRSASSGDRQGGGVFSGGHGSPSERGQSVIMRQRRLYRARHRQTS